MEGGWAGPRGIARAVEPPLELGVIDGAVRPRIDRARPALGASVALRFGFGRGRAELAFGFEPNFLILSYGRAAGLPKEASAFGDLFVGRTGKWRRGRVHREEGFEAHGPVAT